MERNSNGVDAGLECLRENRVVPTGLWVFFPLYPALKRWATLFRAYGAAFRPLGSDIEYADEVTRHRQ